MIYFRENYYSKASEDDLKQAKDSIKAVLDDALKNNLISKSDYNEMNPEKKGPARFYEIFKVHKEFPPGYIPPECPIVSCNGSITENWEHW